MSTSSQVSVHVDCAAKGCVQRPAGGACSVGSQVEVRHVAGRMRLLGHPMRLMIVRELHDRGDASLIELGDRLPGTAQAVRSHVTALYRYGVICRTDETGPALFGLANWADGWLIEQYASRLRTKPNKRSVEPTVTASPGRRPSSRLGVRS